jgi:hypothetical protein
MLTAWPILAPAAAAQRSGQPTLVLTVGAGVHTGRGLWTIPRQPLSLLNSDPPVYDTLRLVRTISTGLVAVFSASYFHSSHIGLHGGFSYVIMGMENSCDPVAPYTTDFEQKNQQTCENLDGSVSPNSVFLLGAGVTLRATPASGTSPYLRAGVGLAVHSAGTVGMAGAFVSGGRQFTRQIIAEQDGAASPAAHVAVGIAQPVGAGYQLRLEVRDDYFALRQVTAAANALGAVTTGKRWGHDLTFTIGLDIVLERRRPRRY